MTPALWLGAAAAGWRYLKTLAWRVLNLFVVRLTVDGHAAVAVAGYLWRHGARSRYGERAYSGETAFVRPADRQLVVAYELIGVDPALHWLPRAGRWGRRLVATRPVLAGWSGQASGGVSLGIKLTLTFVRGTFDPDALVRAAVDEANGRQHARDGGGGGTRSGGSSARPPAKRGDTA
jgi:hypothetical protein